jgi:hypothetical protein
MEQKDLNELLRRFYKAETSLEEEEFLRRYLIENEIPEGEYITEKDQFRLYEDAKESKDIDFALMLDEITSPQKRIPEFSYRKRRIYQLSGIAAGIILLLGLYIGFNRMNDREVLAFEDTFRNNPELAYEETQKVLLCISGRMNSGIEELNQFKKLNEPIKDLEKLNIMNEEMKRLNILNEFQLENE